MLDELSPVSRQLLETMYGWDGIWHTFQELAKQVNEELMLEIPLSEAEIRKTTKMLAEAGFVHKGSLIREDRIGYFGSGYFLYPRAESAIRKMEAC